MNKAKTPNIIWLASYPKSGNTWFRAFLTNLLNKPETAADINNLYPSTIASSRQLFDNLSGISSADLTMEEIEQIRYKIYQHEALETNETIYHKIHDAYTHSRSGTPIIPADVTKAVVYFIRNPLDVAVSFAHHLATSIDRTIKIMNNENYAFCYHNDRLSNQLRQKLLSWSSHVKSWVDNSNLPLLVIRYEDMHSDTFNTFKKAVNFIGLDVSDDEITSAIEKSRFENLKKQENEKGFREKNIKASNFFRKGTAGDWKNILNSRQINDIIRYHKKTMERFGYYPPENR
jgi:hypothetical protein